MISLLKARFCDFSHRGYRNGFIWDWLVKIHYNSFQTPYSVSVEDFFEVRFQLIMLCTSKKNYNKSYETKRDLHIQIYTFILKTPKFRRSVEAKHLKYVSTKYATLWDRFTSSLLHKILPSETETSSVWSYQKKEKKLAEKWLFFILLGWHVSVSQ